MTKRIETLMKAILIECVKRALFDSHLSINQYIDNNSPSSFTIVNEMNNISNIVCSDEEGLSDDDSGYTNISVVNEDNSSNFIDSEYGISIETICMKQEKDDLSIQVNSGDLVLTETELQEAGLDGRLIFDRINQLKNELIKEQAEA